MKISESSPIYFKIIIFMGWLFFISCQSQGQNKTELTMKNPYYSHTETQPLNVSKQEWKSILEPEVYQIAFEKGTERAFTGQYWNYEGHGTYYCAVCGQTLFRADAKFASSCGWPSFFEPYGKNAVEYHDDHSFGMERIEVTCSRCQAHLGHVFNDGPKPTGLRYCMNSRVLDFIPDKNEGE